MSEVTTDIATLAHNVATYLIPALPYLITAGQEAVKEAGKKIGSEVYECAKSLWAKLHPKVEPASRLQGAIEDVVSVPDSADRQGQLRVQLENLLIKDPELARELSGILQDAKNAGATVTVIGDRSVGSGGNVSGSTIITGDHNNEQRRKEEE